MSQTIILQFAKNAILENVKSETYLRGQVEKAADERTVGKAYHESAGDEVYQMRLLNRGLYTNLSSLKTYLSDYLTSPGQSSADNITSTEENDIITITLLVSDRFNRGYTDPLAKLCSKFIEDSMLVDWWKPVNKDQAAVYSQFVEKDLQDIKRCFNKTAPVAPSYSYPTTLTVPGSAICIGIGEEYTVTYAISDGAIDDIEVRIEDDSICYAGRSEEGFTVAGRRLGHTYIELYSRHDPELSQTIHVYVTDQS
jgi:hypothetical protein